MNAPAYGSIPAFPCPAGLYTFPWSREETELRSLVNRHIPNNYRALLKALFPAGRVRGAQLHWNQIVVSLREGSPEQFGIALHPGEWIDTYTHWHGHDLIELVAHCWQTSYSSAVKMLAEHLGFASGADVLHDNAPGCEQELNPLHPILENILYRHGPEWLAYRNKVGATIALCRKITTSDNKTISIFKIILKHRKTQRYFVVEAFPERPYPLYRLEWISRYPDASVVLVDDEGVADKSSHVGTIFSTVPGGLENILDADLTCLKGRKVYVQIRRRDLCNGRLIEQKLRDAEVAAAFFSVDTGPSYPFEKLEFIAGKLHVELLQTEKPLKNHGCLVPPTLGEFLSAPIPKRGWILEPIIPEQGLVMVHALRGVGKTHVGLGIAYACAGGTSFFNWHAPFARGVLFLDGEMSARALHERLNAIAYDGNETAQKNLKVLTPDMLNGPTPDLSTEAGQKVVEPWLSGISLVVVDNIATLCPSSNENGGDGWAKTQSWALDLKRRRISVLFIHHSGKNGSQRGTSQREDVLDTVIKLQRPSDYLASEGARFEVHITKGRHIFGDAAKPFEASLTEIDEKAKWVIRDIVDNLAEQACLLFEQGDTVRDVASKIGVSKSAAGRIRQQLLRDGWLSAPTEPEDDNEV